MSKLFSLMYFLAQGYCQLVEYTQTFAFMNYEYEYIDISLSICPNFAKESSIRA